MAADTILSIRNENVSSGGINSASFPTAMETTVSDAGVNKSIQGPLTTMICVVVGEDKGGGEEHVSIMRLMTTTIGDGGSDDKGGGEDCATAQAPVGINTADHDCDAGARTMRDRSGSHASDGSGGSVCGSERGGGPVDRNCNLFVPLDADVDDECHGARPAPGGGGGGTTGGVGVGGGGGRFNSLGPSGGGGGTGGTVGKAAELLLFSSTAAVAGGNDYHRQRHHYRERNHLDHGPSSTGINKEGADNQRPPPADDAKVGSDAMGGGGGRFDLRPSGGGGLTGGTVGKGRTLADLPWDDHHHQRGVGVNNVGDEDYGGDRPPHLLSLGDEDVDEEDSEQEEEEGGRERQEEGEDPTEGSRASSIGAGTVAGGRRGGGTAVGLAVGTGGVRRATRRPETDADGDEGGDDDGRLIVLVDELYLAAIENDVVDSMTVRDVHHAVAAHLGLDVLDKKRKKVVKGRLTDLITGAVAPKKGKRVAALRRTTDGGDKAGESDGEVTSAMAAAAAAEEEEGLEDDRDDEYAANDPLDGGDDGSTDYEEEEGRWAKRSKTSIKRMRRPSEKKEKNKKKRMSEHMQERHAKARERLIEKARIRRDELGHLATDEYDVGGEEEGGKKKKKKMTIGEKDKEEDDSGLKISEEDRRRAQIIAARFDTNREELRVRRVKDRVGLIDRLRTRRLEIIASVGMVAFGERSAATTTNEDGRAWEEDNRGVMPRLTSTDVNTEKCGKDPSIDGPADAASDDHGSSDDDDHGSSDNDDDDDEDDLEIIAPPTPSLPLSSSNKRKPSTVDLLVNQRAALQNALRIKFLKKGNQWLAR